MAVNDERKRQILDHVRRTASTDTQKSASNQDQRKKQIMDHIKRTQN